MPDTQLIRCPSCGATNRVPQEKIKQGLDPVCGRCHTTLPSRQKPIAVTDATFAEVVEGSPIPVLLDVWATWCHPCQQLAPVIDELAVELGNRVRVAKLDVDQNRATASQFKVLTVPTLLFFNQGREIDRLIGAQPKSAIVQRLERAIAA